MLQNTKKSIIKCIFFAAFLTLLIPYKSLSQDWLGIHTSNYGGIGNVFSQPASTADNRLKVDVIVAAENNSVGNNYLVFDSDVLRRTKKVINSKEDFQSTYIKETPYNGKAKYVFLRLDAIGPSAMVTLSPKHAIGLFSRSRIFMNLDDVEDSLARNIYNNFTDANFWQSMHSDDNIAVQAHGWAEIGLNYARVLYDNKTHFIKGGVNVKYLKGMGSVYLFIKDFQFELKNQDYVSVFQTDVNYGHSNNINTESADKLVNQYKFSPGASVGFDFGLVYEYRPKYKEFVHDLDGKRDVPYKDQNKYLLKVGIALTDIGSLKYTKSPLSYDFHADVKDLSLDTFNSLNSIREFDSLVNSVFTYDQADSNSTYRMGLPTTLSIQIDYHIFKNFYLNFTPTFSLRSGTRDLHKTHYFSTYTLTPRWENKWFGIYNPISYDKIMGVQLGLALRLGPVILGTSNLLLPYFANQDFSGMNAYFMLKVPIPYAKRKDIDHDGVSDKYDQCINLPGTWESKGCPDMDGDGIPDMYDDCPKTFGLPEFHGCPDTDKDGIPDTRDQCPFDTGSFKYYGCPDRDGDGIIDIKDSCPDLKGPAIYNGCPDTDGDAVIDKNDSCPNIIGLFKFHGCPDTDGDGIIDKADDCQTEFGLKKFNGCPDKDNDSVPDKIDHCPNVRGLVKFNGCPDTDDDGLVDSADECPNDYGLKQFNGCPDRDMDGIPDKTDKCPDIYGLAENNGCPLVKVVEKGQLAILTVEEQEIVKTAFEDLEFETGKAVILSKSFNSLDTLANVLIKKPQFKLTISGHTDNVGKAAANQKLSENRAKAVKTYLVQKSIAPERILTVGYGSQRPIAPNTTTEGKQKNRRVEFRIIN